MLHAEFKHLLIPGTTEYFQDCEEGFLEMVHRSVERVLPIQIEKQHQKLRRATEVLEETSGGDSWETQIKRRRIEQEIDEKQVAIEKEKVVVEKEKFELEVQRWKFEQEKRMV